MAQITCLIIFTSKQQKWPEFNIKLLQKNHAVFVRDVLDDYNGQPSLTANHEFTAFGLIRDEINYIVVDGYDFTNNLIFSNYVQQNGPHLEDLDKKWKDLQLHKEFYNNGAMADGLYAFSLDQEKTGLNRSTGVAFMDNNADIRRFLPMNDCFFQNIKFVPYQGQQCLLYIIDWHQLALVNYLGQVKKVIELNIPNDSAFSNDGQFSHWYLHHDFMVDNKGNLIALVGRATDDQLNKRRVL